MSNIPNARPHLDEDDEAILRKVFQTGQIAVGLETENFEKEFAQFLGVQDSAAVASGFAALHLALCALGVRSGEEVILPCVSTCAAIRNAVLAIGAIPIFADTEKDTFNLSVPSVKSVISRNTRAIICPHHTGIPADVESIMELGIPVIEDCAQSLGARHGDNAVGTRGTMSVFSFYPTKIITTVDGGLVASNDRALTERVRDLRYYAGKWDQTLRFNYKMQDLHAALGRRQLQKLPFLLRRRAEIGALYHRAFSDLGISKDRFLHSHGEGIYFRFGIRFQELKCKRMIEVLSSRDLPYNIEVGFLCKDSELFPSARTLSQEVLTFPTYPALSDADAAYLVAEIAKLAMLP